MPVHAKTLQCVDCCRCHVRAAGHYRTGSGTKQVLQCWPLSAWVGTYGRVGWGEICQIKPFFFSLLIFKLYYVCDAGWVDQTKIWIFYWKIWIIEKVLLYSVNVVSREENWLVDPGKMQLGSSHSYEVLVDCLMLTSLSLQMITC